MLHGNMKAAEGAAIIGVIDPDAYSNAAYETAWIDVSKFQQVIAIIMAGTLGSSATINAKWQLNDISGDSGAEDITGKAITALTQAGTDSDKQAILSLRPEEMIGATKSFKLGTARYAKLIVTVGVAASDMGAIVLGFGLRNGLVSANDLASVDEII